MSGIKLTREMAEAAVLGGCVLGGGGGGSIDEGRKTASLAVELADLELLDGEELEEDDVVVNVSAVGAPSSTEAFAKPADYAETVRMVEQFTGKKAAGIITNEAGGLATVNGWIQAALLGLPVVDLPSNGRAHPTGIMGAMGLHRVEGYQSVQAAIGGNPAKGMKVEAVVKGSIERASALVRNAAVQAGGFVAVARNPVTVGYAKKNSAAGAVRQAISLGEAMRKAQSMGGEAVLEAVCKELGGRILHRGAVRRVELTCKGGFDVGCVSWEGFELTFWNEYMTAEQDGKRLGTFPDLIMTLDAKTGMPITSAAIREGMEAAVLHVPKEGIRLGAGMRDPRLFEACEEAVEKSIIPYAFEGKTK